MHKLAKVAAVLTFCSTTAAWAHGDDDHGLSAFTNTAGSGQAVTLSDAAISNLGIKTQAAIIMPVRETITVPALVELLPEKHANITSRFAGKIESIHVKLGDAVVKAQELLTLMPNNLNSKPVTISSPITGKIVEQNSVLGDAVDVDDILMEVADYQQVLVKGVLYESPQLSVIKPGQDARFIADIFPENVYAGKTQRVDVSVKDHMFEVFVLVDNSDFDLLPYLKGELEIYVGSPEQLLMIPRRAILGELGSYYAFVQDGLTFERRHLELGVARGNLIEVLEGIYPGEAVVVSGNYQLQFAPVDEQAASTADTHHHD